MNQVVLLKDYLSSSLKKNDLFFLSIDVFSRANGKSAFDVNASKNYFGYFYSNIQAYKNKDDFVVVVPAIFCRSSDGNMLSWRNIFENIEFVVKETSLSDIYLGNYVSQDERNKGLLSKGTFLNIFSGDEVFTELIKRNLGCLPPVKEMRDYNLVKFPDSFEQYLKK